MDSTIPWPEFRGLGHIPIGEAVSVCQYLDQTLLCIGRELDAHFYSANERKPSGVLTRNLLHLVKSAEIDASLKSDLLRLCDESGEIFQGRNVIVHSKQYTASDGDQSRLGRGTRSKTEFLAPNTINTFTQRAATVAAAAVRLLHDSRLPKRKTG